MARDKCFDCCKRPPNNDSRCGAPSSRCKRGRPACLRLRAALICPELPWGRKSQKLLSRNQSAKRARGHRRGCSCSQRESSWADDLSRPFLGSPKPARLLLCQPERLENPRHWFSRQLSARAALRFFHFRQWHWRFAEEGNPTPSAPLGRSCGRLYCKVVAPPPASAPPC